jgi:hypothetical protein
VYLRVDYGLLALKLSSRSIDLSGCSPLCGAILLVSTNH